MSHPTADATAIPPAWKLWIAENILNGASPRDIADQMTAASEFPADVVQGEVMAALDHPYLHAAVKHAASAGAAGGSGNSTSARADKYAWWMEAQRRAAKLASTHGTVPRVRRPSSQVFLDEFYAANRPCVIEGAIDDWAALTKWQDPAYLKAKCGDQIVEVQGNRQAADANQLNVNQTMPFAEFVDIVEGAQQSDDWYMTANNDPGNADALAALWDDVSLPEYLSQDKGPIGGAFVWYGPGGTLSRTHHDLTNNLMAQVIGRKRVQLVAPNESAHIDNYHGRDSHVNLEAPDLDAHPSMADVTILEVVIGPGDLLFLPVGWWHSVRALDTSFTFTFTNFAYGDNDFYSFYDSNKLLDPQ